MYKYTLLIFTLAALSCTNRSSRYYTYSHWRLPGNENNMPLKGHPKEVKETLFIVANDTLQDAKGKFNNYDLWRFDNDGNTIYRKSFYTDSFFTEILSRYNDSGLQSETRVNGRRQRTLTTQPMADGRFKEIISSDSAGANAKLISFQQSGSTLIITFRAALNAPQTYRTRVNEYKDDALQRVMQTNRNGDSSWALYHYSPNNFLDSILQFDAGKLTTRVIYINNPHGDPLKSYTISAAGDTLNGSSAQYTYDTQGNWIKKQEWLTVNHNYLYMPGYSEGRHALVTREIKY